MADTVYATVEGTTIVEDTVKILSSSGVRLKWHVMSSNFPSDWLSESAFGICDNNSCYYNIGGDLWNGISGNTFTSDLYTMPSPPLGPYGDYHLALNFSSVSTGTHYVTISLTDVLSSPSTSQTTTIIISKPYASSVPSVANTDNTVIYPNPATSELNVVYDASADIKSIAVYNIIGKIMSVYKVEANSANLNLSNLPSGIYFVRLVNSHGEVVVTKKFTKQ